MRLPTDKKAQVANMAGENVNLNYEEVKVDHLAEAIKEQKLSEKKIAADRPQDMIPDPGNGNHYLLRWRSKDNETSFIFLKNNEQLETMKNTMLNKSFSKFLENRSIEVIALKDAVAEWSRNRKVLYSTIGLKLMEDGVQKRLQAKKVAPPKSPVAPVKKVNVKEGIAFIRRIAISLSIMNEQIVALEEDYRDQERIKMKRLQTFFTQFARKKAAYERRKMINCMKLKIPMESTALIPQTQIDNMDYGTLFPNRYYEINFDLNDDDLTTGKRTTKQFSLFTLLTNEIYTPEIVQYFSSNEIQLAPVPRYSVLKQTEFKVINFQIDGIRLLNPAFKYIMAYTVNVDTQEVEACGHIELPASKIQTLEVNLNPVRTAASQKGSWGTLLFINLDYLPSKADAERQVSSAFEVKNFKYLTKFYSELCNDPSLTRTMGIFG
jgi:hypothetical protein